MPKYRLTVEYDGRPFVGWQRQDNGMSVQQALEDAVRGFSGETVTVHGAGRTDAGVHARAQVAHLDIERDMPPGKVADALNAHLRPHPVAVIGCEFADADFHARFSATGRAYLFRIVNRRAPLSLDRGLAWWVPVALDAEAMNTAAQVLVGQHDFSSFRASICQAKSPVKTLDRIDVTRDGDVISIIAEARSFLHNQVRIMTGTLRLVGEGKWTAGDLKAALAASDRAAAGETAPPDGLYLTAVRYD
ncbi:MAG: tRNA pseudouridine(38-40) synthase TruA [Rhodospirillales bacterium]